jgi:hypothetical protein
LRGTFGRYQFFRFHHIDHFRLVNNLQPFPLFCFRNCLDFHLLFLGKPILGLGTQGIFYYKSDGSYAQLVTGANYPPSFDQDTV